MRSAPVSDPESLAAATEAVIAALNNASQACVLPGVLLRRLGLQAEWRQRSSTPRACPSPRCSLTSRCLARITPPTSACYAGRLMGEPVRAFVESCDAVVLTRRHAERRQHRRAHRQARPSERRSPSATTAPLSAPGCTATSRWPTFSRNRRDVSPNRSQPPTIPPETLGPIVNGGEDPITADALYPRLSDFFRPNDVIMTDTGTSSLGLAFAQLPTGAEFQNQTLWASIGWATPAAFGAASAAPNRRLILITGEGSHQMTAQEISQFGQAWAAPDCVRAQQLRLPQRANAVQGHGLGLQRHRGLELCRTSSRRGLPGLVYRAC